VTKVSLNQQFTKPSFSDSTVVGNVGRSSVTDDVVGTKITLYPKDIDENYFIILQQEPKELLAPLADTADMVDAAAGLDPCTNPDDLTGTTTTQPDPANTEVGDEVGVDETVVNTVTDPRAEAEAMLNGVTMQDAVSKFLGGDSECETDNVVYLRVYKSQDNIPYSLEISDGTLGEQSVVTEQVTETLAVDNSDSLELNTPATSNIDVSFSSDIISKTGSDGDAVHADLQDGDTINFDQEITTTVDVNYTTIYDRVKVELPVDEDGKAQSAVVTAYYRDVIQHLTLVPEETGNEDICTFVNNIGGTISGDGECFTKVTKRQHCRCGGAYQGDEVEYVPTQCPDGHSSSADTVVENFTVKTHIDCGPFGASNLHDPDYYEEVCCEPPDILPLCEVWYNPYYGGVEIERGTTYWREKYKGTDVQFIPISPVGGQCGVEAQIQSVTRKSCCDGAVPIEIDRESTPEILPASESVVVYVSGGLLPLTFTLTNPATRFSNNKTTIDVETRNVTIYGDDDFCGRTHLTVTDGCSTATMFLLSDNGSWHLVSSGVCEMVGTADSYSKALSEPNPSSVTAIHESNGRRQVEDISQGVFNAQSWGYGGCDPNGPNTQNCVECIGEEVICPEGDSRRPEINTCLTHTLAAISYYTPYSGSVGIKNLLMADCGDGAIARYNKHYVTNIHTYCGNGGIREYHYTIANGGLRYYEWGC